MKTPFPAYIMLSFALSLVFLALAPGRADAVRLRSGVAVSRAVVTLGDIFSDMGSAADTVILRAPLPGQSLVLSTGRLQQVARERGIDWTPQFGDERLVIERLGRTIERGEILAALRQSLALDGIDESYEIEMRNRIAPIHVALDKTAAVEVIAFDIDSRRTRFSATIAALASDPGAPRIRVAGRIFQTELVPVVLRRIDGGETIGDADVAWRRVRVSTIRNGTATEARDLIGMNARRPLRANVAVRRADLKTPVLISKGSSVKMIYRGQGLLLMAMGRAVEDGARGQEMRVMNLQSKRIVMAKATAPDSVTVSQNAVLGVN